MMIAQTPENSWSELLTSVCLSEAKFDGFHPGHSKFGWIVSNPAQHLCSWRVMVDLRRARNRARV